MADAAFAEEEGDEEEVTACDSDFAPADPLALALADLDSDTLAFAEEEAASEEEAALAIDAIASKKSGVVYFMVVKKNSNY